MYNGIGLQTARGTGTSGYVQANLSNLLFSKNRIQYNTESDIAKAEAEVNRKPNAELLDHEYKRTIEIKCVEFEDLMEGKGFSDKEIKNKVDEYRKLLYNEFESGKGSLDKDLDLRNTHSRAKVSKANRDRMRYALGIDAAFVDGSSLEKIKKASEALKLEAEKTSKEELDKEMEKSLMEKLMEKMKKKIGRKRKRENSSSSSDSSTSDNSDSDSDSSSSSSSSNDSSKSELESNASSSSSNSSTTSSSSAESSSKKEGKKKRYKKNLKKRKIYKKKK